MKKKLSINFQLQKNTGINGSIRANINYGYAERAVLQQEIKLASGQSFARQLAHSMVQVHQSKKRMEQEMLNLIENGEQSTLKPKYIPVQVSTGITLPVGFWDKKNKRAKGKFEYVNEQLEKFSNDVQSLFYSFLTLPEEMITPEFFKERIQTIILDKKEKSVKPFSVVGNTPLITTPPTIVLNGVKFSDFIAEKLQEEINLHYIKEDSSKSQYTQLINRLRKYEEHYKNEKNQELYVQSLTNDFFNEFFLFLRRTEPEYNNYNSLKKGLKKYIEKAITKFKLDKNVISAYKNKDLERKEGTKKNRQIIHLTIAELQSLKALTREQLRSLSKDNDEQRRLNYINQWEVTRDYYYISSINGGARISDFDKLILNQNAEGEYYLEYYSQKTNTYVKIDATADTVEIYKKWGGQLPPCPSEQNFNQKIRVICKAAGITSPVLLKKGDRYMSTDGRRNGLKAKGGERVEKWQVITAHSARKNFVTHSINHFQINPYEVCELAGLTYEVMVKHYWARNTASTNFKSKTANIKL